MYPFRSGLVMLLESMDCYLVALVPIGVVDIFVRYNGWQWGTLGKTLDLVFNSLCMMSGWGWWFSLVCPIISAYRWVTCVMSFWKLYKRVVTFAKCVCDVANESCGFMKDWVFMHKFELFCWEDLPFLQVIIEAVKYEFFCHIPN